MVDVMAHPTDTRHYAPSRSSHTGAHAANSQQRTALLFLIFLLMSLGLFVAVSAASASEPRSVWLLEGGEVAIEMFDCNGLLCGRIVWLKPDDDGGAGVRVSNPQSPLCLQTVMRRLRPVAPGRWQGGSLYDPRDGRSYSVILQAKSADVLSARAYLGLPAFGESQLLHRVRDLPREGWCVPPKPIESAALSARPHHGLFGSR
jgi:uncharacterized protein (DUF2147 family)